MTRRTLVCSVLAAALIGPALRPALVPAADIVEPHMPGWERWLRVDWQVIQRNGRPVLHGSLRNESPYTMTAIQLLVESLDADGRVVAQRVAWASPGSLEPFSRTWFDVGVPATAPQYRVRVYTFERLEAPSRE
ncbi:MAG TPA: hypothetical protein VNO23_03395 [Candidatus Binatia bacterium]|nr:hypothetical protein [Candidatus Binatia bacterium]